MTTKADDLEAVRVLVETLHPFTNEDRERIIRWAREKLGMTVAAGGVSSLSAVGTPPAETSAAAPVPGAGAAQDIATFVEQKNPKSDVHFAAAVAYYYQFLAPPHERKDAITKEDIVDACRKADRKRPARPAQVLVNAYHEGFLDRREQGQYRLNSVGENLVAMVLPGDRESKRTGPAGKARERRKVQKPSRSRRRIARSTGRAERG
jgi:hypothetical protein